MGAECRNKKLFEGNSSSIDPGGHLPSAESTGVAAVAAAGLNAGPVLELDLVAISKRDFILSRTGDGDREVFIVAFRQVIFGGIDSNVLISKKIGRASCRERVLRLV